MERVSKPETKSDLRNRLRGGTTAQERGAALPPASTPTEPDPFIRLPEVRRQLGAGTSFVYAEMAAGRLHRPVRISPRLVVWFQSWITQYQQDRLAESEAHPKIGSGLPPSHPNFRGPK